MARPPRDVSHPRPQHTAYEPPSQTGRALLIGGGVVYVLIALILGVIYLPMALIANAIFGYPWACFNPAFIIRSMKAAPRDYALCVVLYFGSQILFAILQFVASLNFLLLFLSAIPASLILMYSHVTQMRLLGLFFRYNQGKLGWLLQK